MCDERSGSNIDLITCACFSACVTTCVPTCHAFLCEGIRRVSDLQPIGSTCCTPKFYAPGKWLDLEGVDLFSSPNNQKVWGVVAKC